MDTDFFLHCSGGDSTHEFSKGHRSGWGGPSGKRLRELGLCSLEQRWLQWDLTAAPPVPTGRLVSKLSQALQWYTAEGQEEMGINWSKIGYKATLFPWERSGSGAGCAPILWGLHPQRFLRIEWRKTLKIWSDLRADPVSSRRWARPFPEIPSTWITLSTYKNWESTLPDVSVKIC